MLLYLDGRLKIGIHPLTASNHKQVRYLWTLGLSLLDNKQVKLYFMQDVFNQSRENHW